jgi:hypothetical protein
VLAGWLAAAAAAPQWQEWAEQVAKQLVAMGVAPDGRVRSLAKGIPFNWIPDGWLAFDEGRQLVADRLSVVSESASHRRAQSTAPDTIWLLDVICSGPAGARGGASRGRLRVTAGGWCATAERR